MMKPGKTKPDKIPYQLSGKRADATNPQHYSSFEETVEAFAGDVYAGIGIGCFEPLRLVDVDACIVNGKLDAKDQDIVDPLDSYEIIRSFVESIDVYKPEKVPGTRTKKQTICIHWNFIGAVDIPA